MQKNRDKKEMSGLILAELDSMQQLVKELTECKGDSHILRRAKGSILHDFYSACERVFEIIARGINGGVPDSEYWHKSLLYQMTLEVKDVRPAVISRTLAAELDEYLAFRHLFRNIYGFELEGKRLDRLVENFGEIVKSFRKEIEAFIKKL